MLLSELLEDLTYGELSNLALSDSGFEMNPEKYPAVGSALNRGLKALYARFPVRLQEIIVDLNDAITIYEFQNKYSANSGSAEPVKYLIDTPTDVFDQTELLRIHSVTDEDGDELPLNDETDGESVFTPSLTSLQVPSPVTGRSLSVIYRSKHPRITMTPATDTGTVTLECPEILKEPLMAYMASVLTAQINKDGVQYSDRFRSQYELACQRLETDGVFSADTRTNRKLEDNGWV